MSRFSRRFDRRPDPGGKGREAEKAALAWLRRHGFEIVATNVRNHYGEIDVVAKIDDILIFVEIKARSSDRFGPAIAAVDRRKQRRIGRAAAGYLVENPWDGYIRFDVLGLDRGPDGWEMTHIPDAFTVSLDKP